MKYYFSKEKFLKRAPECVKNYVRTDIERWDGMEPLFVKGERAGWLPQYQYSVEAYYPGIYKNYCDKEEGEGFYLETFKGFKRPNPWPCREHTNR